MFWASRSVGAQAWALSESVLNQVPAQYQGAIRAQWVDISADGTFTAYILGSADSTGPTATCTVSGPLGDPVAEYLLPR